MSEDDQHKEWLERIQREYQKNSERIRSLIEGEWPVSPESKAAIQLRSTLSNKQLESFETVRWLYYGGRATGRTYLMLVTAVCEALDNPDTPVYIHDHFHPVYRNHYMYDMLWHILNKLPDEIRDGFKIHELDRTIRYHKNE